MKQTVKNPELQAIVRGVQIYGNLILNDVPVDKNGNVITKKEKERTDKKISRSYYNATFISMENINAARTVTMWQSHTSDGQGLVWKALNPVIAGKMVGGNLEGYIAKVTFNDSYEIDINGEKRMVDNTTMFIPNLEVLEDLLMDEAIRNKLIVVDSDDTSGSGSDEKENLSGGSGTFTSGQGTDDEKQEQLEGAANLEGAKQD